MAECRFNKPPDNRKHDKTETEHKRYFPSRYLVRFDDRFHHGDGINEWGDGAANFLDGITAGLDCHPVLGVAAVTDVSVFFSSTLD